MIFSQSVAPLSDGQALTRVKYLSIDPTMRVWMAADTYLPAVAIGEVMRAFVLAEIIESRHPDYQKGDRVMGLTGLQDYVIVDSSDKRSFQKVPKIPFVSDTAFLGVLGINGRKKVKRSSFPPPLALPAASSVKLERFTADASLTSLDRRKMRLDHQGSRLRHRYQLQASGLERKSSRGYAQRHRHRF